MDNMFPYSKSIIAPLQVAIWVSTSWMGGVIAHNTISSIRRWPM